MQWISDEWNVPSRSDWYQMQTAAEVRRQYLKDPGSATADKMKIKFESVKQPSGDKRDTPQLTQANVERSKGMWMAGLGMGIKKPGSKPKRIP